MSEIQGVIISDKGLFFNQYNLESEDFDLIVPDEMTILSYLKETCVIEEGTTLLDFFNAIDRYDILKAFIAGYSSCPHIELFHEQATEPFEQNSLDDEELEHLEVYWYVNSEKDNFYIDVEFRGVGVNKIEEVGYSVSCTPLYEIADLPLKLNKKIKIPGLEEKDSYFTFQEVLDGIYSDIGYHGGPEENAQFLESMRDAIKDIKNGIGIEDFENIEGFEDLLDDIQNGKLGFFEEEDEDGF